MEGVRLRASMDITVPFPKGPNRVDEGVMGRVDQGQNSRGRVQQLE